MIKITLLAMMITFTQESFFVMSQDRVEVTRVKKILYGGAGIVADVSPRFGTHQIIRQRGLKCPWNDKRAMTRALMVMSLKDSLFIMAPELNKDGSITADIYVDRGIAFDSLMSKDTKCYIETYRACQ